MKRIEVLSEVVLKDNITVHSVIDRKINDIITIYNPLLDEKFDVHVDEVIVVREPKKPSIKFDYLKCYVLVKDTAPIGLGINACSHSGYLISELTGEHMNDWRDHSFRKVTCLVTESQFNDAVNSIRDLGGVEGEDFIHFYENDWRGHEDEPMAVCFAARYNFPSIFRTLDLHGGVKK